MAWPILGGLHKNCVFLGTTGSVPGGGGWFGPATVTGSSDVAVEDVDDWEGSAVGGGVLLLVGCVL